MNTHDILLNQNDFALSRSKSSSGNANRSRSGSIKRNNARPPIFNNSPQLPSAPSLVYNDTTGQTNGFPGNNLGGFPLADPTAINSVNSSVNGIPPRRTRTLPTKKSTPNLRPQQQPPQPLPQQQQHQLPQSPQLQPQSQIGSPLQQQYQLQQPYYYAPGQQQQQQQQQQPQNPHNKPLYDLQNHAKQFTPMSPSSRNGVSPQKQSLFDEYSQKQSNFSQPHSDNSTSVLNRSKSAGFSLRKNKSFRRVNDVLSPQFSDSQSPMLPHNVSQSPQKFQPRNDPTHITSNQNTPTSRKFSDSAILSDENNNSNVINPFTGISIGQSAKSEFSSSSNQLVTFDSLLTSIVNNKKVNKLRFNCNPEARFDIKLAGTWIEYLSLKPHQYVKINSRSLQKQEIIFQLIKYQQLNSKNDKKDFWDTIGYDFLFSQDESIVFPETKAEVYDDFFGYFNTLQQLEELCEQHLYNPLLDELNKNKDFVSEDIEDDKNEPTFLSVGKPKPKSTTGSRSLRMFNINTICVILNTWLFKIIDTYQVYINQLIVTKFWLEMEYFKDPKSNVFLNWLNSNFKSKFPYQELISNYLIDNLRNYVNCFEKLLKLHSSQKSSTAYKKILIIVNSLKTFVNQCHGHYLNSEFKNFLSRFSWNCPTNGNVELKWKNLKIVHHNKINNSSQAIDYLILFNNCLVLCKLDIYLKEFIIKEYPLPIEFLEISDHCGPDELNLLHRGKTSLKYNLKFFDRKLKEHWIKLITETKVDYLISKSKIDPFELIPVSTNFVSDDHNNSGYAASNPTGSHGQLKQYESLLITMALDDSNKQLKNSNKLSGKILCSLTMNYNNQTYHLIGTNYGLYIDDINRTGLNWKKLSGIRNVKQVEFVETGSKLIVFTGDQVVQFDFNNIIKSILDPNYHLVGHDISNQKVFFFKMGFIRGELYLFYRYSPATIKKKGLEINNLNINNATSYFKILKLNRRNDFETFREFELHDINCYDIILLNDTSDIIYLSTDQGFFKLFLHNASGANGNSYPVSTSFESESLKSYNSRVSETTNSINLSKLQIIPSYVYNSENNYSLDERMFLQKIEENLRVSKPIKILETSNPNELLLSFETFAIFINRHTDLISRFDVIHFNLNVENIAFKNDHLFACSKKCIEIFKINNHKNATMFSSSLSDNAVNNLISRHNKYLAHEQIIVAENISLIDSSSSSITIVLDHPLEPPGHQLVMQLVEKKREDKKNVEKTGSNNKENGLFSNLDEENYADDSTDTDDGDNGYGSNDVDDSEDEVDDTNSIDDKYAAQKRKSQLHVESKGKKLSLDQMKIMDFNTRLPEHWIKLWDLTSADLVRINSGFIGRQELIYQLLKSEEVLIFQAKQLHRTLGFKFLSSEVNDNMIYPDTKDSIYRHTFGCLNPLVSFHEKFLLKPMLEILNLKSKELPLYEILELYLNWISEANFIYLEYSTRLARSDWFFDLEKRKETSNFLGWLNLSPQYVKDTLEIFLRHLSNLIGQFNHILEDITKNRDIDSNIIISKINSIVNKIINLNESINSKSNAEKFSVITSSLNWEISTDEAESDLIKKNFLSGCGKRLVKFDEIYIKVNEGQNKIYKKKRLIMLFPNWLLITKFYKDTKVFQVIEKPLALKKIKFEHSTSDHNSINIYNYDGKILYKFSFANRNEKKEWFDGLQVCS